MPYCGNCGNSIIENQNYCPNCGHRARQPVSQNLAGKTCDYCEKSIEIGERGILCPQCRTPHHPECWQENGGCTACGCVSSLGSCSPESNWSPYPVLLALVALLVASSLGIMAGSAGPDGLSEIAGDSQLVDLQGVAIAPLQAATEALGERIKQAQDNDTTEHHDQTEPPQEPSTLLRVSTSNYIMLGGREVELEGKSGQFNTNINDNIKNVTFMIQRGAPNMTEMLVLFDEVEYDLHFEINQEMVGFNEVGDLLEESYIQFTAYDLDKDGSKEAFITVGNKQNSMSTAVFKHKGNRSRPYENIGVIYGYDFMYIENSQIRVNSANSESEQAYKIEDSLLKNID